MSEEYQPPQKKNSLDRALLPCLEALVRRSATGVHWTQTPEQKNPRCEHKPLPSARLLRHLRQGPGHQAVGLCPLPAGHTTVQMAVIDLDAHNGETDWPAMVQVARQVAETSALLGLDATPFASRGGSGVHLYYVWDEPQDVRSVRGVLREVLKACGLTDKAGGAGVAGGHAEIFPKQEWIAEEGTAAGSMFVLPYSRQSEALDPVTFARRGRTPVEWRVSESVVVLPPLPPRAATEADAALFPTVLRALASIPNRDDRTSGGKDTRLSRADWLRVAYGTHHASGGSEEGKQAFLEMSARYGKDDSEQIEQIWASAGQHEHPATAAAVFQIGEQYGFSLAQDTVRDFETGEGDGSQPDPWSEPADSTPVSLPAGAPAPVNRFRLWTEDELDAEPLPEYIVDDWVPARGVGMLVAPPGMGKTFFGMHLAGCIANGLPVGTRETVATPSAYVFAESSGSAKPRVKAWSMQHGRAMGVAVVRQAPDLSSDADSLAFAQALKAGGVKFVVIDVLSSCLGKASENDNSDMAALMVRVRKVSEYIGGCVLLVHHSGKDAGRGARGASAILGAVDFELEISEQIVEGEMCKVAVSTKARDTAMPAGIVFALHSHVVGVNNRLKPVTSLACEIVGDAPEARAVKHKTGAQGRDKPSQPSGTWTEHAVAVVAEHQGVDGMTAREVEDATVLRVAPPASGRDTRRQQAQRGRDTAVGTGRLCVIGSRYYLPGAAGSLPPEDLPALC